MLGVSGNDAQRLRCGTEQDIVDPGLVLERNGGDQIRHGEHDVEIRHVEQSTATSLAHDAEQEPSTASVSNKSCADPKESPAGKLGL